MDTIFAQATASGRAGVAVIRISGPKAVAALEAMTGRAAPEGRMAALRHVRALDTGEVLDEALVLVFPKGASFTGELSVEIQGHGGMTAPSAVMSALSSVEGLRLAEPGEFTRRALENGRLDLAQVEGLADLIEAETEAQRKQAMRLMGGALSEKAAIWRKDLIRARALVEAVIDFADEEVPEDVTPEVSALVKGVLDGLSVELAGAAAALRIREGFEVALVGAPNVGKSTLLNALARRDVAITSEIAGTTRDVLEVRLDLGGLAVTVLDMAGMRIAENRIERLGVDRAVERAENADLRVFLSLRDAPSEEFVAFRRGDIAAVGKADLETSGSGAGDLAVSGLSGEGVEALLSAISAELGGRASGASSVAHMRQRNALAEAERHLSIAIGLIEANSQNLEVMAEEVRQGTHALEFLVGRVDLEFVLDEIFSSFCLGK